MASNLHYWAAMIAGTQIGSYMSAQRPATNSNMQAAGNSNSSGTDFSSVLNQTINDGTTNIQSSSQENSPSQENTAPSSETVDTTTPANNGAGTTPVSGNRMKRLAKSQPASVSSTQQTTSVTSATTSGGTVSSTRSSTKREDDQPSGDSSKQQQIEVPFGLTAANLPSRATDPSGLGVSLRTGSSDATGIDLTKSGPEPAETGTPAPGADTSASVQGGRGDQSSTVTNGSEPSPSLGPNQPQMNSRDSAANSQPPAGKTDVQPQSADCSATSQSQPGTACAAEASQTGGTGVLASELTASTDNATAAKITSEDNGQATAQSEPSAGAGSKTVSGKSQNSPSSSSSSSASNSPSSSEVSQNQGTTTDHSSTDGQSQGAQTGQQGQSSLSNAQVTVISQTANVPAGNDHSDPTVMSHMPATPADPNQTNAGPATSSSAQPAMPTVNTTALPDPSAQVALTPKVLDSVQQAEIKVGVQPEGLGPIEIHATLRGDEIGAAFSAQQADTRQWLTSHMSDLAQTLSTHDFRVSNLTVSQTFGGGSLHSDFSQSHAQGQAYQQRQPAFSMGPQQQANEPAVIENDLGEQYGHTGVDLQA